MIIINKGEHIVKITLNNYIEEAINDNGKIYHAVMPKVFCTDSEMAKEIQNKVNSYVSELCQKELNKLEKGE